MLKTLISLAPFGESLAGLAAKVPPKAYAYGADAAVVAAALLLAGTHRARVVVVLALLATNATSYLRGRHGR